MVEEAMSEADELAAAELAAEAEALNGFIECKVTVPNCHVGEIRCRIPASVPADQRNIAAQRAAAETRGIPVNKAGVPQFASPALVEYLEN